MMATWLARHGYCFRAEKAGSLNCGGFPQVWTGILLAGKRAYPPLAQR